MLLIDRYIARQIIVVTTLGVGSLSTLLLFVNLFKDLKKLLVENNAPISIVFEFILQIIPFSLMFSIPWGFLTAVLLVYGRLSADNELTSMRMAGMSLMRLSAPAIAIGMALAGFCYWVNIEISPRAKQAVQDILVRAAKINPEGLLQQGQAITKLGDQEIYIDQRVEGQKRLLGMHIYQKSRPNESAKITHAKQVDFTVEESTKILSFTLHDTQVELIDDDGITRQMILVKQMPWEIDPSKFQNKRVKANRCTNAEIREALKEPELFHDKKTRLEFETEPVRRSSFSIACIVFALIGVPIAINTRRRDTSSGFAMGILIAALYFVALTLADLSRKNDSILPYLLLWTPNVIGFIVAFILHKKAKLRG